MGSTALTVFDRQVGWHFLPGSRFLTTSTAGEYRDVEIRINRLGFRGKDPIEAFPAEGIRIASLGDSFSHARQVAESDVFWTVLEEGIGRRSEGRPVEVLNFSSDGYSTGQSLEIFRTHARVLAPDVVLLNFYLGNDMKENSHAMFLQKNGPAAIPHRPYWVRGAEGGWRKIPFGSRLRETAEEEGFPASRIGRHSLFGALFPKTRQWVRGELRFTPLGPALMQAGFLHRHGAEEIARELLLYRDPMPADWDEPFAATRFLLGELKRDAHTAGATLIVGIIPEHFTIYPDRWRAIERGFPVLAEMRIDLDAPAKRLAAILREEGIPFVDTTGPLREAAASSPEPLYFPVDRHFTQRGHAVYAQTLLDLVASMVDHRSQ